MFLCGRALYHSRPTGATGEMSLDRIEAFSLSAYDSQDRFARLGAQMAQNVTPGAPDWRTRRGFRVRAHLGTAVAYMLACETKGRSK